MSDSICLMSLTILASNPSFGSWSNLQYTVSKPKLLHNVTWTFLRVLSIFQFTKFYEQVNSIADKPKVSLHFFSFVHVKVECFQVYFYQISLKSINVEVSKETKKSDPMQLRHVNMTFRAHTIPLNKRKCLALRFVSLKNYLVVFFYSSNSVPFL